MFKISIEKKNQIKARKHDIIVCTLEDSPKEGFYVGDILPNGVIQGYFISSLLLQNWPYGENYNILDKANPW